MAAATGETIQNLESELLPHPAYSSNLSPSDYHIFGPLKDVLCGCQFMNNEEVSDVICM
jgi:hypothetical protein